MTTTLTVDGMSCQHCVQAVTKAVQALPGVTDVQVDLAAKTAVVAHDAALTADDIRAAIEDQGYDVQD